MVFGFDIDDTIGDFTKELFKYAFKYDKSLRNNGIINKNKYIYKGMFDWNLEETKTFEDKYIHLAAEKMQPKIGVKKVLKKLKEKGYTIIFITARNFNHYKKPYEFTIKWFKENNIIYDKLIVQSSDKIKTCIEEKVDVYVDDISSICEKLSSNGIKCYLFDSKFNKKYYNKNIKRIENWKNFYKEMENYEV